MLQSAEFTAVEYIILQEKILKSPFFVLGSAIADGMRWRFCFVHKLGKKLH